MSRRVFLFLDRNFAVTLMLRLWATPLFGDPNIVGRVIGFIFRTVRIVIGSVLIFFSELAILFYFLLWLTIPFLIFSSLKFLAVFILVFWLVIYSLASGEKAAKEVILNLSGNEELTDYASRSSRLFISAFVDSATLLSHLLKDRRVKEVVLRLGYSKKEEFFDDLGVKKQLLDDYSLSEVLRESWRAALDLKDKYIEPYHLLLALLKRCSFKSEETFETISWLKRNRLWHRAPMIWEENFVLEGLAGFNRSWTGRVTPTLNKFGVDLTTEARDGRLPLLVGKKRPLSEVIRVLEKGSKNNVILVGQPGCGKTSLVFGIAEEIVSGTRSRALMDRRLFSLELGKLIAGANTSGDLQERMMSIIKDIEESGNIILFIDEIQNAVSAGGGVDTVLFVEIHLSFLEG